VDINNLTVLCTSVPGRYALALFNEGKRSGCLDEIFDNFQRLETFFDDNPQIKKLLMNRCIDYKDVDEGWLAVSSHLSFCPVFVSFVRQVGQNRRFDIFERIKYIYRVAIAKYKDKRSVTVISAVELLPEQKDVAEKIISKLFSKKTIITYGVDPSVLGGIRIVSEETIYDATVYAQLKQITKYLKSEKIG
jgi:F-type H+-transporting ATPase subunit delta